MWAVGSRTKKLIVAFHFEGYANQAGWKCEECRKAGLETKRRCGWQAERATPARIVWARKRAATEECPRSFITTQSLAWLEQFLVRRKLGAIELETMSAREAEAFLILEQEWEAEVSGE